MSVGERWDPAAKADQALVTRVTDALHWWENEGRGPTSSVTGGGAVRELERRFAAYCGRAYAVAVSSGTLALRTTLAALAIGRGDQVICSALDWPAAASSIASVGATPVFADVEADGFTMAPESVAQLVTPRTRCVIVTHVAGVPARVDRIQASVDRPDIAFIEDGSQAFGATLGGRPVGSLGTAAAFSLGPGKMIDAGEGGVLVTDDPELYGAAISITQHPTRQLLEGVAPIEKMGITGRIHPVAAIMGVHQFTTLDQKLRSLRSAAEHVQRVLPSALAECVPCEKNRAASFSWPCVPAIIPEGQRSDLRTACLEAMALGLQYVPAALGQRPPTRWAEERASESVRLVVLRGAGPSEQAITRSASR
jgi:dTDP-4-amino-4,6-dideoxygalactose transaminase